MPNLRISRVIKNPDRRFWQWWKPRTVRKLIGRVKVEKP